MKEDRRLLASRASLPEGVVYRSFDVETVLLNLDTGQYHGLNLTGTRVLELLVERQDTVQEAIQQVADEYGQDPQAVTADLVPFCRALAERGLVEFHAADDD